MGNCLTPFSSSKNTKSLPISTIFKLPSPIPNWLAADGGFASGTIDLGGLQVHQITSFTRIWATYEGGPDDLGATFFEPTGLPDGFSVLGCYAQPNNRVLSGWVLVGKDDDTDNPSGGTLAKPTDYTLAWSSESSKIQQDGQGYIWLPTPPDGYRAVGHVVTTSPQKPSMDRIRCVRSDLTDASEMENWIWGESSESSGSGLNLYGLRPGNRGVEAQGVSVGTFIAQNTSVDDSNSATSSSLYCLKNNNFSSFSSMPTLSQIQALFQSYSPFIYFHPSETYLPSSVNWYFNNGALLYENVEGSKPVPVELNGSNLPQGDSNDGAYWLDLPVDEDAKEKVKKGDLQSSEAYLHIKPMLGGTFTDIAAWLFYPFNGPSTAKLGLINIPLGRTGEHIGDWEHLTLRVSNFNGVLYNVYFSQHSRGTWVDASLLEYYDGTNKPVAYSALHGHALYPKPGLVLQGSAGIGIRNDTAKSEMVFDMGARYSVIAADYIPAVVEPPWVNYYRKWGPKITYERRVELDNVGKSVPGDLISSFERVVNLLPAEVYGEDGPTGPKVKNSWNGDEP